MRKQNFFLSIVVIVICSFGLSAQVKLGVRGGLNISNQSVKNEAFGLVDLEYDTQPTAGWQIGFVTQVDLNENWAIEPTATLISKGYRYEDNNLLFDIELVSAPIYFHIPVPVYRKFAIGTVDCFAGIGPYLSFGVAGAVEVKGDVGNFDFIEDGDIDFGDDFGDTYSPIDWGLTFNAGVDLTENMQLMAAYEAGIANIQPEGDDDNITRNGTLAISFTYFW